ncbi:tetratricopeptide repeat protein [Aquifex aeolicus]|uniref:tetratricopeptide repeat protein n=1 Tax=Aquifex aeolicus TaxID=63363 RepID=UPI0013E8AA6C|nr:tetratricopeptide repeat protein [Aquifex aeolicus]
MFGKKGVFSKMAEGLVEKLAQELEEEVKKNPKDPELLFKLGIAYIRAGKVEKAREVYKQLRNLDKEKANELLDRIYEV